MANKNDDGLDPDEPIKMELIPHEPTDGDVPEGDVPDGAPPPGTSRDA